MNKYLSNVFGSIFFIGMISIIVWGCKKPDEAPEAPEPVSRKIVMKKEEPSKPQESTAEVVNLKEQPALQLAPEQPKISEKSEIAETPETPEMPETSEIKEITDISKTSKTQKAVDEPIENEKEKAVAEMTESDVSSGPDDLYNPVGRVNPFMPLFKKEQVVKFIQKKTRKKRTPLTPLEKLDLSQLMVKGIILANSGNRALVEDATGKGYVVATGTYMGIHAGRVSEILKDRVIVEEEGENALGKISILKRELKLQKPIGEE